MYLSVCQMSRLFCCFVDILYLKQKRTQHAHYEIKKTGLQRKGIKYKDNKKKQENRKKRNRKKAKWVWEQLAILLHSSWYGNSGSILDFNQKDNMYYIYTVLYTVHCTLYTLQQITYTIYTKCCRLFCSRNDNNHS